MEYKTLIERADPGMGRPGGRPQK